MKKIIFFLLLINIFSSQVFSQKITKACSSKMRKLAGPKVDSTILNLKKSQLRIGANATYMIKLFVVIFADDDGSNASSTVENVRKQIERMSDLYRPHNICFVLAGTQQSNNTDHNNQNVETEEDEIAVYRRTGYITIFVHNTLYDNSKNYGGYAYSIPNNYLSIVKGAADEDPNPTLAHEMGHCFGLYHTFETDEFGKENVKRSASSCVNCETAGDLLCDTPADLKYYDYNVDANCNVLDNGVTDDCDQSSYTFPTHNIMSYGEFVCHDHFTSGQGSRARSFIITTNYLENAIASDDATYTNPINYTSGIRTFVARNFISIENSLVVSQSAQFQASAKEIIVKPGANFTPNADGFTVLLSNPFCN